MRGAIPPKIHAYSGTGVAVGRAVINGLRGRRQGNLCSIPDRGREFVLSHLVKPGTEAHQAPSSIWVLFQGIKLWRREAHYSLGLRMRGAVSLLHPACLCFVI
jgi:hypothetical protein